LRLVLRADGHEELLRRFVEASRRAQIVTIVNRARSETELGELVASELCEAFEAEIAFVLAARDDRGCYLVGAYGLQSEQVFGLLEDDLCRDALAGGEPQKHRGDDLLATGIHRLVLVPFGAGADRGVVGVGRMYDERFDEAEVALLEAIAQSIQHALERIRLGEERDRLYREAHERGQAARVLGSVADGVFLVDATGIVRLWNPAAEAMTGLPAEAVLGRRIDHAIPGWATVAESVFVASDPAASTGRATTVPVEIGGRELWLSIAGVGFAEGTVYAFRDLTQERRLDKLKADFIATVSHELRTPIAAVHGAAKTLQREDVTLPDDLRRHLLAVISEQSERLGDIVNDILLASQVDDRTLPLATGQVDAADLAQRIIEAARTHAPKALTLDLVAPPALPAVAADPDKLRQVLGNLVGNAVKYSPDGGRIEVRLEPRETDLCITVRDEGLGIAEPELPRIFDKFYRVDPNMTRGVSGSGLGLYICRELVRRMGGSIWVESTAGKGSAFFVILPLALPEVRTPTAALDPASSAT
jgi:two-component system, OmpR family, phosphate regulon sensor histidine kinase PhoR